MTKRKEIFTKRPLTLRLKTTPAPMAKPPAEKAEIGLIHGEKPGSTLEWNVSQALDIMELDYEYQYQVGMPGVSGSQRIDFYVYTPGLPTPLLVHGRYWHTGIHADPLDDMKLAKLLGGRARKPVIIWEEDCGTVNDALTFLRANLATG